MANIQRNFIRGRMNKSLDERLVPNGEYINAVNVRLGSTEDSEIGAVENSKGNTPLTELQYIDGTKLSSQARCIGAFEDGANLVIYWFVHDPAFTQGATGKLDLVVSFDVETGALIYHVVSIDDGDGINTTLNFNPNYLITGIDKIDNLVFFTDNYNPPRVININKNYGDPRPAVLTDDFNQDDILVIKKPPISSPVVVPFLAPNLNDGYLEDKFICFGYRYKYENKEYSAISQFSVPAFTPGAFNFSSNSYLNEGMVNINNAAYVTFNTGSSKVTDIQLVFKEANSSIIKVIETFNKKQNGWLSNQNKTVEFTNRKIFTVLPGSEILRLYDNVPQLAKAQTLMGNRLVYGNYFEGYDLTSANGSRVNFEFTSSLKTEDINYTDVVSNEGVGDTYLIDLTPPSGHSQNVHDSTMYVDLGNLTPRVSPITGEQIPSQLVAGTTLTFSLGIGVDNDVLYAPSSPVPIPYNDVSFITWSYTLIKSYASVYDLATDTDFQEKIGVTTTIQTVANAVNGSTLTDRFNAIIPQSFDASYDTLVQTGRTLLTPAFPLAGEPLGILPPGESGTQIGIQLNAAIYNQGGVNPMIAYFRYSSVSVTSQTLPTVASLHSNRGYEVGMVYMDDYNRASTAQVSPLNAVNLPCSVSNKKNYIQVTIPTNQKAPSWATKYKFVIKPTKTNYETIYSNIVYNESGTDSSYFLLDGENANKVEAGDRLIVKADTLGPKNSCVYATVLEKESQAAGFINVFDEAGAEVEVFGGTYMKINASNFVADADNDSLINTGPKKSNAKGDSDDFPVVAYPFFTGINVSGATTAFNVYTVPAGTRIHMSIKFSRQGVPEEEEGGECLRKDYTLTKTFTASRDYENMKEWWEGDNIDQTLNEGVEDVAEDETISNIYISPANSVARSPFLPAPAAANPIVFSNDLTSAQIVSSAYFGATATTPTEEFYYRIYEDTSTQDPSGNNLLYLLVSGSSSCGKRAHRQSHVEVNFDVYRADSIYVFETKGVDALPDVWYENNESFDVNGDLHLGNVQNQTTTQPALVNPGFFNCYTFGNGVESNKIRDSLTGEQVTLGNRIFTTSNEEYARAHRFADLTYSGVFNDESNVNKLNEFNLGLVNFKPLEETYGDVEILYARETDILVLQEDKISYVLAGKNLLSDATGGGAVTSVPEVLGTQIARIEQYGISNHPESFAAFGENKYFSDAKRNVVIKLTGTSAQNEVLTVVSNEGMRSWFRDLFAEASATQKLGGYDPYMHEYVFSTNTIVKPETELCIACGVTENITILAGKEFVYCVDIGEDVGPPSNLYYVEIDYVIPFENSDLIITEGTEEQIVTEGEEDIETEAQSSGTGYTIEAIYDGVTYTTGVVYQSGTLTFPKPNPTPSEVVLIISTNASVNDTIQVTVKCPEEELFSVYSVTLTTNANAGQFIHTEYLWESTTLTSPTLSDLVTFAASSNDPIVSQYRELEGPQGSNIIPPNGASITMRSNKVNFDNFVFNPTENQFRYLRTDALYENNSTDINILLAASVLATPINSTGAPTLYTADFTMPAGGNKLYLIYDLRQSAGAELCYSAGSYFETCCDCTFTPTPAPTVAPTVAPSIPTYDYFIGIDCETLQAVYLKANTTLGVLVGNEVQYSSGGVVAGCASLYAPGGPGNDGAVTVVVTGCGDSRCSI